MAFLLFGDFPGRMKGECRIAYLLSGLKRNGQQVIFARPFSTGSVQFWSTLPSGDPHSIKDLCKLQRRKSRKRSGLSSHCRDPVLKGQPGRPRTQPLELTRTQGIGKTL